jgi:hypothetical protein
MGLHEIKKLCTTKEMASKLKRPPIKWKKIFASYISDKELVIRIYRELKNKTPPKINESMKKWSPELNRTFSKKEVQMTKKHMKCSPSLTIKEMQIKITLRFYLTPDRIATIKYITNNKCWWGCGVKKIFTHCWWECKVVQQLWKTIWRLLKK